jgi:hypothetical protein
MCMWLPSFFFLLSSDFRKYREIRPKNKKRRDDTRRLKVPLAAERPGTSLRGGATSLLAYLLLLLLDDGLTD